VTKNYQTSKPMTSAELRHAMPETGSVTMAEIVEDMWEGLLALPVGAGLQVMSTLMEQDVSAMCGPKGKHDPARTTVRHGTERGSVTLGGRRVPVQRPRMRAADGTRELPVASYELFSQTEVLGRMAMARMLAGLSSRRYPVGLEPVGQRVEESARSTSKSAVSRRFVAATETALAELLAADLSGLDLVALMIDGVHFGEHLCVVALGIGIDGVKHPLGLAEGSTENTTVVTDLLTGLRERGLDTTRPIFVGIDGGKALRAAVVRVFDHPVIGRCQTAQVAQRRRQAARSPGLDRHQADARRVPGRVRDPGPSAARSPGQGTGGAHRAPGRVVMGRSGVAAHGWACTRTGRERRAAVPRRGRLATWFPGARQVLIRAGEPEAAALLVGHVHQVTAAMIAVSAAATRAARTTGS